MMRNWIFLLLNVISLSAFARGGATVGDGGHGVRCGAGFYELLDFYEARRLYKMKPNFPGYQYAPVYIGNAMRTVRERAYEVVPQTRELDSVFATAVAIDNSSLTQWWSTPLKVTPDFRGMTVPLPKQCEVVQFARRERLGSGYRYLFFIEAWDQLYPEDQAALILHEASHVYFKSNQNTLAIRQFVTYLAAPDEFRKRNSAIFKQLVETRQAVDPRAFRN